MVLDCVAIEFVGAGIKQDRIEGDFVGITGWNQVTVDGDANVSAVGIVQKSL